mmetsp:Transcript_31431/g.100969  ORF Transcript_31431/g.100969 Transcript_31431/m.100969 type:complete len:219 (+) Transcript_31431:899-1555(+)
MAPAPAAQTASCPSAVFVGRRASAERSKTKKGRDRSIDRQRRGVSTPVAKNQRRDRPCRTSVAARRPSGRATSEMGRGRRSSLFARIIDDATSPRSPRTESDPRPSTERSVVPTSARPFEGSSPSGTATTKTAPVDGAESLDDVARRRIKEHRDRHARTPSPRGLVVSPEEAHRSTDAATSARDLSSIKKKAAPRRSSEASVVPEPLSVRRGRSKPRP